MVGKQCRLRSLALPSGAGHRRFDGIERRTCLGAVRSAGLRHVRPPAPALAAQRFGRDAHEIDRVVARGEVLGDADDDAGLAIFSHADNRHDAGAELFLARISLLMLLGGLIWTLAGREMLRELRFPLLVLLLGIPWPKVIYNQITFPLQILASKVASAVLPVFGVPVLRDGNIIQLPSMPLEVAEACSGIRSLMSLFTAAVFYGYFLEPSVKRRVILALAAIPIAVAANGARIVGTGLAVQYWDPEKALGFFHEFSGWLIFCFSLVLLYLLHSAMNLWRRPAVQR